MSSHLQNLPAELLLLILEHISAPPHAIPALAALCLTSRRLRSLAEPYLYISYSNQSHLDRPHIFPLTLIDRPDLADRVRRIDLRVENALNPMPEDALRRLQKAIDELDLPEDLAVSNKSMIGRSFLHRAAVCAELCLLSASRRAEHLSLHLGRLDMFPAIDYTLFHTPNWAGKFDYVQSISVAPTRPDWELDLYGLAYMFKMPNLRRFEITSCEERQLGRSRGWDSNGGLDMELGNWRLVQGSSVESIVIRESGIRHPAVNVLLNCCKAVKHLHVEVDLRKSEWHMFQFFRLEDALCRHADSLEHLAIVQDKKNRERQKEPGFRDSGCLSFLPQLRKIRSLVVPLRPLTAIPDVGTIQVISNEGALQGKFSDEAEIRQYLPPSPESISICNDEVYYGNTTHLFGLA